jgi:hypothetical protein
MSTVPATLTLTGGPTPSTARSQVSLFGTRGIMTCGHRTDSGKQAGRLKGTHRSPTRDRTQEGRDDSPV